MRAANATAPVSAETAVARGLYWPQHMVDELELKDLPHHEAVVVSEMMPLSEVVALVGERACPVVVLREAVGTLRGVVRLEAIRRMVVRLPDVPVRMLPTMGVAEVSPHTSLTEAMRLISTGSVVALVTRVEEGGSWRVTLRDDVLNGDERGALVSFGALQVRHFAN